MLGPTSRISPQFIIIMDLLLAHIEIGWTERYTRRRIDRFEILFKKNHGRIRLRATDEN